MATKKTARRKRSSSAAGEYVREEMHEAKKGKMPAKQAIAIGLSRARRAGEDVPPPKKGRTSAATRKKAESDYKAGSKKRATKKSAAKKSTAKKSATKKSAAKKKRTAKKSSSRRR